MTDDVVRRFAKAMHDGLAADHWGCIEPDTFRNIAEGLTIDHPDGLWADKESQEDMAAGVESLTKILRAALATVVPR
jgi:hypothetical protein